MTNQATQPTPATTYSTARKSPYRRTFKAFQAAILVLGIALAATVASPLIYAIADALVQPGVPSINFNSVTSFNDNFERYYTWTIYFLLASSGFFHAYAAACAIRSRGRSVRIVFGHASLIANLASSLSILSIFGSSIHVSSDEPDLVQYILLAASSLSAYWLYFLVISWVCTLTSIANILNDTGERCMAHRLRKYAASIPIATAVLPFDRNSNHQHLIRCL